MERAWMSTPARLFEFSASKNLSGFFPSGNDNASRYTFVFNLFCRDLNLDLLLCNSPTHQIKKSPFGECVERRSVIPEIT